MKHYLLPIISLFLLFSFQSCQERTGAMAHSKAVVFPGVEYGKVVAYDYEGPMGENIFEKGKLYHNIKKEKVLDAEQISYLLDVLNDEGSYGGDITRCFRPRLGFVFYDAQGRYQAQVSVCFECNQHQASPQIKAQDAAGRQTGKQGYSTEGRKKLIELCQSLGFSNCGTVDKNIDDDDL